MKKIFSLIVIVTPLIALSQSFSDRTNEIVLNFTKPGTATSLPVISWKSPRIEYTNSTGNSIEIEADVQSDVPIKSIAITLKEVSQSRGGSKPVVVAENTFKQTIRNTVHLLEGQNEIAIVVENVNGGKVSSSRFVSIGRDALANAIDIQRTDYALIFATDRYDDWDDLTNPVFDGRTIESILTERYGFKTEFVENPSHEEILDKIYEYNLKTFRPQDQLFIFFAGHGFFDDNLGEGFVVARNSLMNDAGKTTYLPHSILRQRIDNIKCEHIFLTMDVCFGGTLDPVLAKARGADAMTGTDVDFLIRKLSKRTRKFLTSGSKEYVPDGTPGSHSPFAAKFIQALKENGGTSNRILTIFDFYRYFQRLPTEPRFGKFSDTDDPASDFVFVAKQ